MPTHTQTHSQPLIAIIVIFLLLELIVSGRFHLFGAVPSYMFILTVCVAYLRGANAGCICGFMAGLLFDVLGSGHIGVAALFACILGYLAGVLVHGSLADGFTRPVIVFAILDLLFHVAYILATSMLGAGSLLDAATPLALLGALLADTLTATIVIVVLSRHLRRVSSLVGNSGF